VALSLSIEFGVVFILTVAVYLLASVLVLRSKKHLYPLVVLAVLGVSAALLAPQAFLAITAFVNGGFNWPFVPSISLVLFFLATFALSWRVGTSLHDFKGNIFFLSLALLSFACIPAALGRCDPGHVLLNGMMILALVFVIIKKAGGRGYAAVYGCAFLLSFVVLTTVGAVRLYSEFYLRNTYARLNETLDQKTMETLTEKASRLLHLDQKTIQNRISNYADRQKVSFEEELSTVPALATPFGTNDDLYTFLMESHKFVPLFWVNFLPLSNADIAREILDFKKYNVDYVLLPVGWENLDAPVDQLSMINTVFATYYMAHQVGNSRAVYTPFVTFIKETYEPYKKLGTELILRKRKS
jgi:hypothetical protein